MTAVSTPIPFPSPVSMSVLPGEISSSAEFKSAGKPKVVKRTKIKKSMLSRAARSQMALLAVKLSPESAMSVDIFGDHDVESSSDDLDLHRSFSRPKVADLDDAEDQQVSDYAKLRLFMARMKALEAHKLAQVADVKDAGGEKLSDAVKLRLSLARMKAVQAHEKKFS